MFGACGTSYKPFLNFCLLLASVKKLKVNVGGACMKRLMYVIPLSAIAVLVFATIAAAQSVLDGTVGTSQGATQLAAVPAEPTAPAESTTPAPDSTTTVEIRNNAFNPPQLNVAPGTTVTFVNNDTVPHTATADNGLFDSGELAPGASYPVVLDGAGTVTYHCKLHPEMQGSIVVGEAGQASEAGEGGGAEEGTTTMEDPPASDPMQRARATQDLPGSDSTQTSGGS
jgi:plastocyanin